MTIVLETGENADSFVMVLESVPEIANETITIKDARGRPLPGVKVTFGTTVKYTRSTGIVRIIGITKGTYPVTLEKEGYQTITCVATYNP